MAKKITKDKKRKREWNRNRTEKERIEEKRAAPLKAHCVVPL
jgi:hypothetical protein